MPRNALVPDDLRVEDNPMRPSMTPTGEPDPNTTEGWIQIYRDWKARQADMPPLAEWLKMAGSEYANALLMGSTAPGRPGFRAFHGSPHSFERFDTGKIGTGEGAQAYGHGLYFAEHEGTARSYRDAGPASSAAFDAVNQRLSALAKVMEQDAVPGAYRKFRTPEGSAAATEYDALMEKKAGGLGNMYEVNVNADPEHFLHWDKPLSEQSPHVQKVLKGLEGLHPAMSGTTTGEAVVSNLENYHGNNADAAQQLREAGIPGIRYLDQGSRGAGEGTHNLVVFNPENIEIIRKYGLAGLGLGTAATAATQGNDNAQ